MRLQSYGLRVKMFCEKSQPRPLFGDAFYLVLMTVKGKNLTEDQVMQKLRHYCEYQERCHSDVRNKLYELSISPRCHKRLISALAGENLVDEQRFACAFVRGRFK